MKHGQSVEELADFLCRTRREVIAKAVEMGHHDLPLYKARRQHG